MKRERISIKWKVFIYLLGFISILLILLWLFQTVYLDVFYMNIKEDELDSACENLYSVINDSDLQDAVETISERYDIYILITNSEGDELFVGDSGTNRNINRISKNMLSEIYADAVENGGELELKTDDLEEYMKKYGFLKNDYFSKSTESTLETESLSETESIPETEFETTIIVPDFDGRIENGIQEDNKFEKLPNMPNKEENECLVKVKLITTDDGNEYMVILNSVISPVGATVHTLRIQLIYISIIMIILSLIIALVISRRVSRSIIRINESAKELSEGNYDVEFDGKDYREITELSDTLNNTAKQLSKTDVLQKELIANVSHDLRTPLTMITAYSEVMRDLPGENTPENVQVIIDEAKRLTNLVNDLLDMSKIQAGVTSLETKEYDLTESIMATIARHSKLLEPYGYVIDFDYEEHIIVSADEFKIYQVIYNLIGNAVNYTGDNKKVLVRQTLVKEKKEDGSRYFTNRNKESTDKNTIQKVRIEVIDSGVGIPESELENVWERYYKVDKDHKRAVMGSGLGLSIVKNILKLHNAAYGAESIEGKGSTFWFELEAVDKFTK